MKKSSTYEINGNLYEFNNDKLRRIIKSKNPNRGAFEEFYRKVVSMDVGISYDTVKGWVKKDTNPALEDVKIIAEILEIPYMQLLECTHYNKKEVQFRLQKIRFEEVTDAFSLKYDGFSNVLDMIIGMGHNSATGETIISDFAERIIDIIGIDRLEECELPKLLGYSFIYSDDEIKNMAQDELEKAMRSGYVDDEGNSFYDEKYKIMIDRHKFGKRLIENTPWLNAEDQMELKEILEEAEAWWNHCEMPYALLKIDINACGRKLESFTYGPGWVKATHEDRWRLFLDVLALIGTQVDTTGLCWMHEMHVNQYESEFFATIEVFKHYGFMLGNIERL